MFIFMSLEVLEMQLSGRAVFPHLLGNGFHPHHCKDKRKIPQRCLESSAIYIDSKIYVQNKDIKKAKARRIYISYTVHLFIESYGAKDK